jgi:hypothetical protein
MRSLKYILENIMKNLFFIGVILFFLVSIAIGLDFEKKTGSIERSMPSSVVFDPSTGLYWEDTAHSTQCHGVKMSWENAINYCESLSLQNYDDWRLPNINELQSMSPVLFRNLEPAAGFWSSTTVGYNTTVTGIQYPGPYALAFKVDFYDSNHVRYLDAPDHWCAFRVMYNGNTNGYTIVYDLDEWNEDGVHWVHSKSYDTKSRLWNESRLWNVRCVR